MSSVRLQPDYLSSLKRWVGMKVNVRKLRDIPGIPLQLVRIKPTAANTQSTD
jgi:hypothetical protein